MTARSVGRDTPRSLASRRSDGSASPTCSSSSIPRISSRTRACLLPRPFVCAIEVIPRSPGRQRTDWSTIGQDQFAALKFQMHWAITRKPMSRARIAAVLAFVLAVAPIVAVAVAGTRPATLTPDQHFGLVGGAAVLTSLASLLLSVAGARARDGRAILMGAAFSTMTALFAIHALSTPGFLVGKNGLIALAGGLSVPAGVFLLALTALPALRRPADVRALVALQIALLAGILALGVTGMLFPQEIPAVPTVGSTPANVLFGLGGTCLLLLIARAVRTYRLTRRTADLTVAVGCIWLGVTLYANLVLGSGTFGFYSGHVLEILAVAFVGLPAALDIKRAGASRPLVGDLTAPELVASEEAYLGPRV